MVDAFVYGGENVKSGAGNTRLLLVFLNGRRNRKTPNP